MYKNKQNKKKKNNTIIKMIGQWVLLYQKFDYFSIVFDDRITSLEYKFSNR